MRRYSLGIDVGGTFTDFVAYDRTTRSLRAWKNLSTPQEPADGVLTGLQDFDGVQAIDGMRLGTTVATNTLLERKGAMVAYVATRGFRDIPFVARGNRLHHYDLTWVKSKPLFKRRHGYEVNERIGPRGEVIEVLDESNVRSVARNIAVAGEIESIAVVLLHSYVRPDHEFRIKQIFREELPDTPVSISYEVLPRWKEHFRSSTTICDAYVKPMVRQQLGSMRRRLDEAGIDARMVVMKSNGGEMSLEAAADAPIQITVSGPTGGVIAGKRLAHMLGISNIVTLDMGGTSTDVSAIVDGRERFTTDFEIEWGRPIQIPMIDIRTIGAGGGSLARIDAGGMLVVGPESAGASPGPACYGQGGTEATVTDANLTLGRIGVDNFLGSAMRLDADAAAAAISRIAQPLGLSLIDAALAIVHIANNNMVGALHTVLVEQGLDPRDFTLLAFGGAGPLHVGDLMTDATIPRGMVPILPGQFSAFGFVMADARVDRHRTLQLSSRLFDQERASMAMSGLVRECLLDPALQGYGDRVEVLRSLEMRYQGQNYELEVAVDFDDFTPENVAKLWKSFHEQHEAPFGFRLGDAMEIINFIVTAVAHTDELQLAPIGEARGALDRRSQRSAVFAEGRLETPVYARADLRSGHRITGPALVEEDVSVTVVNPRKALAVDRFGNLYIDTAPT